MATRLANRVSRALLFLLVLAVLGVLVGFLRFSSEIAALDNPQTAATADGIVVLTGGKARIETALDLLAQKKGRRLLISGVHPQSTPDAIRTAVGGKEEWFDCCVDIDRAATDTAGNADETAKWATRNGFASLIVVTSDYHMPRALMEMRRHRPDITFTPWFVIHEHPEAGDAAAERENLRLMASEYVKFLAAGLRFALSPATVPEGLAGGRHHADAPG